MYLDYKKRNRHVDIEKLVRDCRPPLSLRGLWPEPVDRQDSRHPFPHTGFRSLVPENFPSRDLPGALRAGHPGPVEKRAGRRPFSTPHPEPLNTGSLVPESSLAGGQGLYRQKTSHHLFGLLKSSLYIYGIETP
jgi:hypothetical protein